jgi:phosphoglucosamine mutase
MSRKFFGTDGVRGPYGGPVVNDTFAARLAFAAAAWLRTRAAARNGTVPAQAPRVLIGRDTRLSGAALEAAIARGLRAGGAEPISLGILPTPAVSRAVVRQHAALGVVITASHNPAEDNGIKFFGPAGVKLTDADELAIENLLPQQAADASAQFESVDGVSDYLSAMSSLLAPGALTGWRIVLDTANGATCGTSPRVLRALGAHVVGIGESPDGRNINAGVGSEHPALLAGRVRSEKARLGIAHDGDGDRCVLCDEAGQVLDGDEILAILALRALERGALPNKTLVVTVQSNLGLDAAVAAAGGRVLRTAVGDRYVIERMLAEGATLGGESSGHIICSEISPTGDGLVAALKVIEVMVSTGRPLSELRRVLKKYPQASSAVKVREKKPLDVLPRLSSAIRDLERALGSQGRVLVRWSGTEPKLRLLVEGPMESIAKEGLERLKAAARSELAVVA